MTRMQTPERLIRATLVGAAAFFLLVAPVSAQLSLPDLPDAPVDVETSTGIDTPAGRVSADASQDGASACADLHADGDDTVRQATGLTGGLPVEVPPIPVDTPSLPAAGADTCVDADLRDLSASAQACADAKRLDGAVHHASGQSPVALPELPVDASSADLCAEASADAEGRAEAGADARAGPVQQSFKKAVDAFGSLFGAIGSLF